MITSKKSITLRLTQEMERQLKFIGNILKENRSQVLTRAINLMYYHYKDSFPKSKKEEG